MSALSENLEELIALCPKTETRVGLQQALKGKHHNQAEDLAYGITLIPWCYRQKLETDKKTTLSI